MKCFSVGNSRLQRSPTKKASVQSPGLFYLRCSLSLVDVTDVHTKVPATVHVYKLCVRERKAAVSVKGCETTKITETKRPSQPPIIDNYELGKTKLNPLWTKKEGRSKDRPSDLNFVTGI